MILPGYREARPDISYCIVLESGVSSVKFKFSPGPADLHIPFI